MFNLLSRWMLPLAPIVGTGVAGVSYAGGLSGQASCCAWVAVVCALWWIFETLPIAVVGLLPSVAFPLMGVLDHREVARAYGDTMILLLMGGFFLSAAMEKSGTHRRIALSIVNAVGSGGRRLVFGFMLATALLSMWISNTATTMMILPIALAVLSQAQDSRLRTPLLLGIAYSASIGGMATPIGTPPNVMFMGYLQQTWDIEFSFAHWMMIGLPIVALLLPVTWLWISRGLGDVSEFSMPAVGPWRSAEVRVLSVFAVTALAWMLRAEPWGGWPHWLGIPDGSVGDSTVALGATLFLFLCPSGASGQGDTAPQSSSGMSVGASVGASDEKSVAGPGGKSAAEPQTALGPRLLDWESAAKIPWGILIMFGGGLALASGFKESHLSDAIARQLSFLESMPTWAVVLAVCLLVTFMTEITSGTATANLMMPILADLAVAIHMPPESIMIPGTISASCAFMLPVATAPNVIVFGAGGLRTSDMARNGLMLNFYAAGVITLITLLLV